MNSRLHLLWRRPLTAALISLTALLTSATPAWANFRVLFQGQHAGDTNTWDGGPLLNWKELDSVPMRLYFTGGPASNQLMVIRFDHTKGTSRGIESLTGFSPSTNVLITSPPTLSSPAGVDIWSYSFNFTVINAADGFVTFFANLFAGSHSFNGASLSMSLNGPGLVQIVKPTVTLGSPDLAITKTGPSQARTGQVITYVINYTNKLIAANTALGVQVTDILPPELTYVPNSGTKGVRVAGNTLTWDLGNLTPGKRGILTYKAVVSTNIPVTTTFANYAQILCSQDDANLADNVASVTTTVVVIPTPLASDDFYATGKNTGFTIPVPGVLINDSNAISATLLTAPVNGTLVFNTNGSFSYTPATNFLGTDVFAYQAVNSTNISGPAIVTIEVTNTCFLISTANVTTNNSPGQCGAVVTFPPPVTTGDCAPIVCTPTSGSFFPVGTNTVTCTNSDGLSGSFQVTVLDTEPPAIACSSNLVLAANPGQCSRSNVVFTVTASDNCTTNVTLVCNPPSGSTFSPGLTIVTCTANDANGNTNSCTFTVTVNDGQPPAITCPANLTVNAAAGSCASNVSFVVTASDVCGTVTNLVSVPASGSAFPVGVTVVTNTATDDSGNSSTCTFTVTVRDNQPPVITCPASLTVNAAPGQCASNVNFSLSASDACGTVTNLLSVPAGGSPFPVGVTTVTNTATDDSGNTSQCTFSVTVLDNQGPAITCPANVVVNAAAGQCASNVSFTVTATDACGAVTNQVSVPPSGSAFPVGVTTVTNTATDASGNTSQCSFTVTVNDTQPPTITCPADVTTTVNAGACFASGVALGNPSASDNCGAVTVTSNAPAQFPVGTNLVTWTATDGSGNTATCQQRVVVSDSQPPTIACSADVTVSANSGTCFATGVTLGSPTASDNCGPVTVTSNAPAQFPTGTNFVTWTATDGNGNATTCQQRVIVRDAQAPTITCPADVTVNANAGACFASGVTLGSPTASDNCGAVTVTSNAPAQFPVGTNFVTWTATDSGGNATTCQQRVVVRDTQAPSVTCPADVTVSASVGACFATGVALGSPTASDNCGAVTVTSNAPAQFPVGTNLVTWTATDGSGNAATCQQRVIVRDIQAPAITCPADVTVSANAGTCFATGVALGSPTASDNCGAVTVTSNAPAQFPTGTNFVTWTATDGNGNASSCQQRVIVRDAQAPTITCPADLTVNANTGACFASGVALGSPTASDNCGAVTVTSNAPAQFPEGTNFVTWTATDSGGNTATCQQRVVVRDTQAPAITCPADVTVSANVGACFATGVALGTPSASDNCGAVTVTSNAPAQFPVGTNLVTWTATDGSGNSSTCQQRVIVRDSQSPSITCPAEVTVNANPGACFASGVVLGSPVASDNCGAVTVTSNAPAQFPVGTNLVTWTATDTGGNATTCQQRVIVRDAQSPTISCPADLTVNANAGACFASGVALGSPTASDNCGAVTVTSNAPAQFPVGTNFVTWTATDSGGNAATCQQRVIVRDAQPPAITCPADVTVNANSGSCFATGVVLGGPTASDNCGAVTVTSNAPAQFPVGTNLVTWTATDSGGNTTTCQQRVIVRDVQVPTIACPADVTANANAGTCFATGVVLGSPTASDNCGAVTITSNAPAQFAVGTNVVTWTATDAGGNSVTCQQRVVVRESVPPTITCPAEVTVNANLNTCFATGVALGTPTTGDNCGPTSVTNNAPAQFPVGTNTVTWTVTEGSGNSATCQQRVIVRENPQTVPTITCPADLTVNANPGTCVATGLALGSPNTSDNCGPVTVSSNVPAQFVVGTNVVTWTANDASGNSASCQQRVIVRESVPPTITCAADVTVNANAGACFATGVALGSPTASDDCGGVTVTSNAPAQFPVGTNLVTWTATDGSGNTTTCQQRVIVRDNQVPSITCPANVSVTAAAGQCGSNVAFTVSANDACGSVTNLVSTPASGSAFPVGVATVTSTATDNSGNTSQCSFTVTVTDTQAPAIACSSNLILNAPAGQNSMVVNFPAPTVSDNCPGATGSCSPASGSTFPLGTTTVTCTARDSSSNQSTCSFTVTVNPGNNPPVANPQNVPTPEDTPVTITLTGSDPGSNPLTFAIVSGPTNGMITGFNTNSGTLTYTPNTNFLGGDSFSFRVNDGATNSTPATVGISVTPLADVRVFKTGTTNGGTGTNLSFTITVTNAGLSTASNVVVFDQLPASYLFVSAVPPTATVSNNLVRWPAFNLASLTASNFVVTATPTNGGVYTNIGFITSDTSDPDPTNNNGISTNSRVITFVQPLADVAVLKSGPASVVAGGSLTYTILATNLGPSTATNVIVSDPLPAGTTFQSASGSFTVNSGVVTWAGVTLAPNASATFTVTVTAPLSGSITNSAAGNSGTPDPDPTNNNGSSPPTRVVTTITPIADVALFKTGPATVAPGQTFNYTITVTNLGPVAAANVVVQDLLPTNLVFVTASGGGVFATNTVTWPTLLSLASGAGTNYTLTVTAPASGTFTNLAISTSTTQDPNPTNNTGSPGPTIVSASQFGILKGTNSLNPQTGLYEQRATVTNTGSSTVAAFRLLVGGLRNGVSLRNATGTNVDSRPYVLYNAPLNPGSFVTLILEFFVPDRGPFTNSLEAVAVLPVVTGTNAGAGVVIDRAFVDSRFAEPRYVIEWTSVPGKTYTVIYSDTSPSGPWLVATPTVTASANRTQWYDDGPPKTVSKPASVSSRYYRVIANP